MFVIELMNIIIINNCHELILDGKYNNIVNQLIDSKYKLAFSSNVTRRKRREQLVKKNDF
jgi:hypothetical protein